MLKLVMVAWHDGTPAKALPGVDGFAASHVLNRRERRLPRDPEWSLGRKASVRPSNFSSSKEQFGPAFAGAFRALPESGTTSARL